MQIRTAWLTALAMTCSLGLVACGSDDDSSGGSGGAGSGGAAGSSGGAAGSSGGAAGSSGGAAGSSGGAAGAAGSSGGAAGAGGGGTTTLSVDLNGLEPLGSDYVYEGWVIVSGAPVSTGRFDVVTGTTTYDFEIDSADAAAAAMFVLSIEPMTGDDPAPADTKILGGAFTSGVATLTIDHMAALGDDLSTAAGGYILETPSTSAITADYNQGVWFLDPAGGPGPSLTLPTLPAGWQYEGWVADSSGAVSTGTFTAVSGADSDGAGPEAGADMGPPFPGQDFITPARVLGATDAVVISIEPDPDNSPMPFSLKPLVDMSIEDPGAGVLQTLTNMSANNPTGTATLQ